jgi:alpha-glucosidase
MTNDFLWWRDGVIYQIYPRSFQDSNRDGIGDLNGINQRLDYLSDLGIDAIWLSPIYTSPDVDFGYDVADYQGIDPKFGSMQDFDNLLANAHSKGIRLVMDLVLNHTSNLHPWFQQSSSSRDNPYRDWYIWRDKSKSGGVPNNWQSRFGGSGWEWDEKTQQYYFHFFYKEQPDLNWRNPQVQLAILEMIEFWLKKGVDGFRLDVFNAFFKSQGFENNPSKLGLAGFDRYVHQYDYDQPEMLPFLAKLRDLLDAYPERYSVGESFETSPQKAASYCSERALHATFDFTFMKNRYSANRFYQSIQRWENLLQDKKWPNYVLNNHDVPRAATRYVRGERDARLQVLAAMLLTLRGTPFLYFGEEIGMRDIPVKKRSEVKDPIGKHYWPFYKGRDGCRAPMQWDSSQFSGFSEVQPWLPVHINKGFRNVQAQLSDPDSLLNTYKKLIAIRKNTSALQKGMYLPLTFEPRRMLAYMRKTSDQEVLVALNFSNRKVGFIASSSILGQDWRLLYSNKREQKPRIRDRKIILLPNEVLILERST